LQTIRCADGFAYLRIALPGCLKDAEKEEAANVVHSARAAPPSGRPARIALAEGRKPVGRNMTGTF
jgi:hypothetical protein